MTPTDETRFIELGRTPFDGKLAHHLDHSSVYSLRLGYD
jgi:hypothetical protein